ncbi:MAG: DUF192 domain-containing protein [Planctomycetota bacterium]
MAELSGRADDVLVSSTGISIATEVEIADTWWRRFKGLQFRQRLPENHAILLRPCSSIHTFWMRFAIDVAFLNGDGCVIDIRRNVRPWRVVLPKARSVAVLEMASGELPAQLSEGDAVCWSDGKCRWAL